MRLEPLYRATFAPTASWHVGLGGEEEQGLLFVEGRVDGRIKGRLRASNFPRRRGDGTLTPDFRGVLETDDGATLLFAWQGYGRMGDDGSRQLLGSLTHLADDDRYRRLNRTICVLTGHVVEQEGGFEVVLDVAELAWEPASS